MKIEIIGIGNLGNALARLIQRNLHIRDNLIFTDKKDNRSIEHSDILFLCVNPNDIPEILKNINCIDQQSLLRNNTYKDRLIVSCAAGVNIETFEKNLHYYYPVVRCMTNIAISNITYFSNKHIKSNVEEKLHSLLKGPEIIKVEDEKLIDLSTVLIGSLPAFASYLSEPFIQFGEQNGLTYEQSRDWYISTILGTIKILKENNTNDIIRKVCSPGGITEKGIDLLAQEEVKNSIKLSLKKSLSSISNLTKNKD